jgi:3'-5' exoribonuclease
MSPERDIAGLRAEAGPLAARLRAQVEEAARRESSAGKPYFELRLRDASGALVLRAWSDTPAFEACRNLQAGAAIEVEGEFFLNGSFGLDARRWRVRALDPEETSALYAGGNRGETARAMADLQILPETIADPRLAALCRAFLDEFGGRFARAAAARANHHAWRGGLAAHTAQMLRAANALCAVYPSLNSGLLRAAVLFHDCGKLWETCPPEEGFVIGRDIRGELLGHISIGIEVVNNLWKSLPLSQWTHMSPPSEDVRLHLLHLIASHHGELEFGSPVQPKTPEAIALHAIDNLDAKLEMLGAALAGLPEIAPGIRQRLRPLSIHPVQPLPPPADQPPAKKQE